MISANWTTDNSSFDEDGNRGSERSYVYQRYLASFTSAMFVIISILGTVLNTGVVVVILRYRRLRRIRFNYIVVNLATVDLISCLVSALTAYSLLQEFIATGNLQNSTCYFIVWLQHFSKWTSLTIMAEQGIIRVIYLSCARNNNFAHQRISKDQTIVIIAGHTLATLVFSAFRILLKYNVCNRDKYGLEYYLINNTCLLLIFCSLCITGAFISRKSRNITAVLKKRLFLRRRLRRHRYDLSTFRTCMCIVTFYMLCHLPYITYGFVLLGSTYEDDFFMYAFTYVITMLSFVVNPILLFITSKEFRIHALMCTNIQQLCRQRVAPVIVID